MQFDEEYQKELIGRFCSPAFMKETGHLLTSSMFEPEYAEVIKVVSETFSKKHKTLTKGQLSQLCQSNGVKASFAGASANGFDRKVVLQFVRTAIMRRAMAKMHVAAEKGNWDKTTELLLEARRSFPLADDDIAVNALESSKPMPVRKNLVPTGLTELDGHLSGGVAAGDIAVILAPTSGGKTSLLTFFACQAVRRGKKVYYVTLEVPQYEIEGKMRRCFCDHENPSKASWAKTSKSLKKKKGRFHIREYAPYEVGIAGLELAMPRDIDLLVVDYADYLKPPSGALGIEFQDLGKIYSGLKAMAMHRSIPVWTASQVNRDAYGQDENKLQDVDASIRKMMRCDQAIGINQTEAEQEPDEKGYCWGKLGIIKNRHGTRFKNIEVTINWARVSFEEGRHAY